MTNQTKVGIFSIISIVIFVLGFYFLKGINIFERKNSYYAVYQRVDGLYKSNEVEINGFPVGRVGDMRRDPATNNVIVRLDLDKGLKVPDSDSTVASMVSTDFLGTKKIQLVLGNSDRYLKEGDTINTFFKKDLTEQIGAQIDPIMNGINSIVPKVDSTVAGLSWLLSEKNPKGVYLTKSQIDLALYKLNLILAENQATIQATLKNLESITGNIQKNNDHITGLLKNMDSFSDSLKEANMKQTIENLNNTITQLKGILTDMNAGKGTLGKVMKDDALYAKVDSAVGHLDVLLKDVKARPYRYINISVFGQKQHEKRMEEKYNETGKP